VAHSYAQDVIPATLNLEPDRENVAKTTTLLQQVSGVRPKGWISPRGTAGGQTLRLLAQAGYEWHSDVLDDDKPYLQNLDTARLVAIPFTMDINDLPPRCDLGAPLGNSSSCSMTFWHAHWNETTTPSSSM